MTAIDMPSYPGFVSCRFGLQTNTQTFISPLTRATQRLKLGGDRWLATYSLPYMNRTQASGWKAFLDLLEGGVNTFNAYDPDCLTPRGAGGGTPLVNGGSQTGSSLITDGWPANTIVLKAGDPFSVNGEYKRATADVLTNGSGQATIPFKPTLRSSPADNAPLTVTKPTCTMALTDDMQAMWECNQNGIYMPKTFSAYEVFS